MPWDEIKPRQFPAFEKDLDGISRQTMEDHYKLYEGYVKKTNALRKRLTEFDYGEIEGNQVYSDLRAVYDVCVRTADAGGDARGMYSSDDLMPDLFAGPYVFLEPEFAFVLDDGEPVALWKARKVKRTLEVAITAGDAPLDAFQRLAEHRGCTGVTAG